MARYNLRVFLLLLGCVCLRLAMCLQENYDRVQAWPVLPVTEWSQYQIAEIPQHGGYGLRVPIRIGPRREPAWLFLPWGARVQAGDEFRGRLRCKPAGDYLKRTRDFRHWLGFYLRRPQLSCRVIGVPARIHQRPTWMQRRRTAWAAYLHGVLRSKPEVNGVVMALLLGDNTELTLTEKQRLVSLGLMHVLAVSGLHMTVLFGLTWPLTSLGYRARVSVRWVWVSRYLLSLLATLFFVCLTGGHPSAWRAWVMLCLHTVSRLLGLGWSWCRVWWVSTGLLLVIEPTWWVSTGFWLSVVFVGVLLELARHQHRGGWADRASLFVLWYCMQAIISQFFFGYYAPLSPVLNVLIMPLFSVVVVPMLLAVLSLPQSASEAVLGWLSHLWQGLMGFELASYLPAYHGLLWRSLDLFSSLFTLAMLWLACRWGSLISRCLVVGCASLWMLTGGKGAGPGWGLHVLDVGQGEAVLLTTAHHALLFDTGNRDQGWDAGWSRVMPYLSRLGIHRLDRIIISHPDRDHAGGLATVMNFEAVESLSGGSIPASRPGGTSLHTGDGWHWDGSSFVVLMPIPPSGPNAAQRHNEASVVLYVRTPEGTRLLLTGDHGVEQERMMMALWPQLKEGVDVVLVPHHGSKTSSASSWLAWLRPSLAIVSAGFNNRFGHPHPAVLARYHQVGSQVWQTAQSGDITVDAELLGKLLTVAGG